MRYAITCCIHGNMPALEAVLKDIDTCNVDEGRCLGDLVGYGPEPKACIDLVRERGWPTTMGNHEAAMFDAVMVEKFNPRARDSLHYSMGNIGKSERDWIKALPIERVEQDFYLVHGSPVGDKIYKYVISEDDGREALDAAQRTLTFIGHTHHPCVFRAGDPVKLTRESKFVFDGKTKTIVNVGSVGQPRDKDPRACWVLYDTKTQEIELRRVAYDTQEACRRMVDAGLPPLLGERIVKGV